MGIFSLDNIWRNLVVMQKERRVWENGLTATAFGSFGRMLGRSQAAADNRAGLGSETAAALQQQEEEEEEADWE